jgi:uncharacterized protein YkwD
MKFFKTTIFILIIVAFGAGIYFKDDFVKFYDSLGKQAQDIQKIDVGSVISEVGKEISAPSPLNAGGSDKQITLLQSQIIVQTNLQRKQNGNLSALTENEKLDEAASAKANDILLNQYFEHISPSGVGPGDLAQKYGYDYVVEGENLILGNFSSEQEVVQDWMNSPGHRANILNVRYAEIGVAIIKGTYKGETAWVGVQEFGLPMSACPQIDTTLKNQIDSDNAQLDALSSQISESKNQIDATDSNSKVYGQMVEDYNKLVEQYNSLAKTTKNIVANYNNQVNAFNNCVK